jgi:MFS family permease
MVFFTIWMIPCAVAPNIQTMLVARFLDGLAGSAFLSVAGGTVGDLFARRELGGPMMVYTASPLFVASGFEKHHETDRDASIGPELGPIVGGFINQYTSWLVDHDALGRACLYANCI